MKNIKDKKRELLSKKAHKKREVIAEHPHTHEQSETPAKRGGRFGKKWYPFVKD